MLQYPFNAVNDSLSSAWRLTTQRFRHFPTTVIVGAQNAGVPQLYSGLLNHPRCFHGADDEVDYFSTCSAPSLRWYRSRFPLKRRVVRRQAHVLEASPSYLSTPSALRKMQSIVPNVRIVVLLCDPVERAFAHYQRLRARQLESCSFGQVVESELRSKGFPAARGVLLAESAKSMRGCVAGGYYALQIELLLKLYRRNRVIFIDSASLFADPGAVCERVFSYMGLECDDVELPKATVGDFHQVIIDPRVAERLRAHYAPYDELLKDIVGQQFSWMQTGAAAAAA